MERRAGPRSADATHLMSNGLALDGHTTTLLTSSMLRFLPAKN